MHTVGDTIHLYVFVYVYQQKCDLSDDDPTGVVFKIEKIPEIHQICFE